MATVSLPTWHKKSLKIFKKNQAIVLADLVPSSVIDIKLKKHRLRHLNMVKVKRTPVWRQSVADQSITAVCIPVAILYIVYSHT